METPISSFSLSLYLGGLPPFHSLRHTSSHASIQNLTAKYISWPYPCSAPTAQGQWSSHMSWPPYHNTAFNYVAKRASITPIHVLAPSKTPTDSLPTLIIMRARLAATGSGRHTRVAAWVTTCERGQSPFSPPAIQSSFSTSET
jgi:hypothetical protein